MKLNKGYLSELILEVLSEELNVVSEIEENFGATAAADVLQEAWDSQWPSEFYELKSHIKDFTNKGTAVENILAKYALEALTFNHLGPTSIWNGYLRLFKSFVRTFVRDEGDLTKVRRLINKNLTPALRSLYDATIQRCSKR